MPIQRVTMFKVPNEANHQPLLDAYKTLEQSQQKDNKPYILEIKVSPSLSGERGKGYNFVAMTRFRNLEDMKYYDEECEAHKVLKRVANPLVEQPWQPPLTVFFEEK
ncbi:hypothetical protein BDY17DRAFT_327982 [Neohortaea acidophila]|uniref:Stress-response A/B barrel domain-containing protein n=1 Tax=Neohortaea acidophila TaxID=245834 RepID=A0A6A6PHI5_9PEZI|nr:uncharacterized protein BDY17DRAFT_327982 [Neohortaea acidophila]KAF2479201.1 hypothetical protein BDY17DRAFT_327982 [Neohortaea acidophila]